MRLAAFRTGAAAWIFTGLVHDILELTLSGDPGLNEAMRASEIRVGPFSLDAEMLNRGVSLSMGWAMITVGVLLWMIASSFKNERERLRPFGIAALAASVGTLALAAVLIPGPPLVTFTVAVVAFIAALAKKDDPAAEPREQPVAPAGG